PANSTPVEALRRRVPASRIPTPSVLRDDLALVRRAVADGPCSLERTGRFRLGVEDAREDHVVAGMKARVAVGVEDADAAEATASQLSRLGIRRRETVRLR